MGDVIHVWCVVQLRFKPEVNNAKIDEVRPTSIHQALGAGLSPFIAALQVLDIEA